MTGKLTFTMIKPTAFKNNNTGAILKMINDAGFVIKGGNINPKTGRNVNRKYERKIHFINTSILSGLKNDDWEEALEELKDVWQVIEKIDWSFLKKPIAKHQKATEQIN